MKPTSNVDHNNAKSVESFFDHHAPAYSQKYSEADVFYRYFFYERLEQSTKGLEFAGKRILDVGSGTGALYDYLRDRFPNLGRFVATDISSGMLSQSHVPREDRLTGDVLDLDLGVEAFDYIFMLGVTTYIEPGQLREQLVKLSQSLVREGTMVLTFTNRGSLDIGLRSLLQPLARLFAPGSSLLSQDFNTWYYTRKEVLACIPAGMEVIAVRGLNHTFFPLSRLLPGASVGLARLLGRMNENRVKHFLSSDWLILLQKKQSDHF